MLVKLDLPEDAVALHMVIVRHNDRFTSSNMYQLINDELKQPNHIYKFRWDAGNEENINDEYERNERDRKIDS